MATYKPWGPYGGHWIAQVRIVFNVIFDLTVSWKKS
jgi:hypothetical protein